jgi:subfamily B ATP-binding cassette protein MsbA
LHIAFTRQDRWLDETKGQTRPVGHFSAARSSDDEQRIGIAGAVIRDNPILILDEPTAALDTESEKRVMEALERLMKGRTVITIAHRLSTIGDANKIIVLKTEWLRNRALMRS